jgi:hypothetical protein
MEAITIDKLPEVEELTNDDLFPVDQSAVTKNVKLEKINGFIHSNTMIEVNKLLEAEANARMQGDDETLKAGKKYTDQEITKNKLAVNEWFAPVKTVSQIPITGLDNTRNYLIKVVADSKKSGVYQAVAGWTDEPKWLLYDNTVDLVDEEELEAAIGGHNADNEAHEDIRAAVKKIDDDYITSGELGKAVSELETSLTETANNFDEALYNHNNNPASHSVILEAVKKIDDDYITSNELGKAVSELKAAVDGHNADNEAHEDIRAAVKKIDDDYVNETDVTDIVNEHNLNTNSHIDIRDIISNHTGIPVWDSDNYILTFTAENGDMLEVDIPLESLTKGLDFDPSTKELVITRQDGSEICINIADLIEVYEGSTGAHIQITVESGNVIKAALLSGSITESELSDALLEKINGKTEEAPDDGKMYGRKNEAWAEIDLTKIDLTELETAISNLDEKTVKLADVGQSNGVASLDEQAKVPLEQLPTVLTGDFTEILDAINELNPKITAAQTTADTAKTTADTAKTTADTAKTTADTAKTTATNAQTTANTANTTANTAKTTADTANTTANNANTAASNKIRRNVTSCNVGEAIFYSLTSGSVTFSGTYMGVTCAVGRDVYGGYQNSRAISPTSNPTFSYTNPDLYGYTYNVAQVLILIRTA